MYDFPRADEGNPYSSTLSNEALRSMRRRDWAVIIVLVPLLIALAVVAAVLAAKN